MTDDGMVEVVAEAALDAEKGLMNVVGWTDVVYLTTGKNCTLGITAEGNLLMAGYLY